MMGTSTRSRYPPFTAEQWEELQQQALIYKYMVSGVPVPPHLIFSLKRSLMHSSSTLFPHHPIGGWEMGSYQYEHDQYYEMIGGLRGRKIDTEPGRCRRTDGKKWRCSKEAYPDSKYCERHMHRGRHRSRKPVELLSATTSAVSSSTSSTTPIFSSSILTSLTHNYHKGTPLLYQHSSSAPPALSLSSPTTTTHHHSFDTDSFSRPHKDYRYLQVLREEGEDERASFLPESATTVRSLFLEEDPYSTPLKMTSSSHHYSRFNFHNLPNKLKEQQQQKEEGTEQCFVLGTDIKSQGSNKPFHHFFSDCKWPSTSDQPNHDHASISVSMPLSTQDLFQSKPTPYC